MRRSNVTLGQEGRYKRRKSRKGSDSSVTPIGGSYSSRHGDPIGVDGSHRGSASSWTSRNSDICSQAGFNNNDGESLPRRVSNDSHRSASPAGISDLYSLPKKEKKTIVSGKDNQRSSITKIATPKRDSERSGDHHRDSARSQGSDKGAFKKLEVKGSDRGSFEKRPPDYEFIDSDGEVAPNKGRSAVPEQAGEMKRKSGRQWTTEKKPAEPGPPLPGKYVRSVSSEGSLGETFNRRGAGRWEEVRMNPATGDGPPDLSNIREAKRLKKHVDRGAESDPEPDSVRRREREQKIGDHKGWSSVVDIRQFPIDRDFVLEKIQANHMNRVVFRRNSGVENVCNWLEDRSWSDGSVKNALKEERREPRQDSDKDKHVRSLPTGTDSEIRTSKDSGNHSIHDNDWNKPKRSSKECKESGLVEAESSILGCSVFSEGDDERNTSKSPRRSSSSLDRSHKPDPPDYVDYEADYAYDVQSVPMPVKQGPSRNVWTDCCECFTSSSDHQRVPRIFRLLTLLFAVLCVVLVVVIVAREFTVLQQYETRCVSRSQQAELQENYPTFFRTEDQQEQMVQTIVTEAQVPQETQNGFRCSFHCLRLPIELTFSQNDGLSGTLTGGNPVHIHDGGAERSGQFNQGPQNVILRTKRTAFGSTPIYHACCRSYRNHSTTPELKNNAQGVPREIVQLDGFKQYFPEDVCEQMPGCDGCLCAQPEPTVRQAVVYKNKAAIDPTEKYEVDNVLFDGCCKCLNVYT